jgi:hypothetical protein
MKITTTERGWIGHFCGGHDCRFRRNTLVSYGKIHIVVSTVGQYRPGNTGSPITVGLDRYYETMIFHAERILELYWDADVTKEISVKGKWTVSHKEDTADGEADAMHNASVLRIIKRIQKGEFSK